MNKGPTPRPLADRFWEKVNVGSPDECWDWTAKAKTSFGYGRMTAGRKVSLKAHRVSWELANGPIPPGMNVCHRCDRPACCNPNHLFLGTKKDNTHDMMKKGRMKKPPVRFGENHHAVTIPDRELSIIRASNLTAVSLAEMYSVTPTTIYRIKRRESRNYEDQPKGN